MGRSANRDALVAGVTLALALLGPRTAQAYRPFDGTDADVAKPGEFELELGPAHFYREGSANFLIAPAAVLNLGLPDGVELVSDFKNFLALDPPATNVRRLRLRDTDLLAKIMLRQGNLQEASGPSIALETGVLLPEPGASSGFGTQVAFIVSVATPRIAVHVNESLAINRDHRFEEFASAIVEIGRALPVHPVAEAFVDRAVGGGREYSLLAGTQWAASETLTVDAALRGARADGEKVLELRLGVTWSTPLWKPHTSE